MPQKSSLPHRPSGTSKASKKAASSSKQSPSSSGSLPDPNRNHSDKTTTAQIQSQTSNKQTVRNTVGSGSSSKAEIIPHSLQQAILQHFTNSLSLLSDSSLVEPVQLPAASSDILVSAEPAIVSDSDSNPVQISDSNPGPDSYPESLRQIIQGLKSHLYARDFAAAFGSPALLRAYAARWSPSRALGYAALCFREKEVLGLDIDPIEGEALNVVCLGGGAGAEIVGLTAAYGLIAQERTSASGQRRLKIHLIDSAAWDPILTSLREKLESFLPPDTLLEYRFQQLDLLSSDTATKTTLGTLLHQADLITLFFTLNELYATSLAATTAFLLDLGQTIRTGTRIVVVDSAGSYAGVVIGDGSESGSETKEQAREGDKVASKQYPMSWMLDHTLLQLARRSGSGDGNRPIWKKLLGDESRWFRRDKACEYALQLEDMRYQVHVYERI